LNCAAPMNGPFCSNCGQRAIPPHPTVGRTGRRTHSANFQAGTENSLKRFACSSLGPVSSRGIFLDGKRVRYVSPVRLYLGCSLVYSCGECRAQSAPREPGGSFRCGDEHRSVDVR
jgi:hypothetical protein